MNRTHSQALAHTAKTALDSLDPAPVVTLEFPTASTAVIAGTPALLIDAPEIEWPNWAVAMARYTVWAIAPSRDLSTAWDTLDSMIDALVAPLNVLSASPAEFRPHQGPPVPAYRLTLESIEYGRTDS